MSKHGHVHTYSLLGRVESAEVELVFENLPMCHSNVADYSPREKIWVGAQELSKLGVGRAFSTWVF